VRATLQHFDPVTLFCIVLLNVITSIGEILKTCSKLRTVYVSDQHVSIQADMLILSVINRAHKEMYDNNRIQK